MKYIKNIKKTFLLLGLSFAMERPDESKASTASDHATSASVLALEAVRRERMAPLLAGFCEGFDELATSIDNEHGLSADYWALEAASTKKQLAEIATELDEGKATLGSHGIVNFNVNKVEYRLLISPEKRDEVLKLFKLDHEMESYIEKEIPLSEIKNLILNCKYLYIVNEDKKRLICMPNFSVISTPDLPVLFCQLSKFKAILAGCVKEHGFSSCQTEKKYLDLFRVMVNQADCRHIYLAEIS